MNLRENLHEKAINWIAKQYPNAVPNHYAI